MVNDELIVRDRRMPLAEDPTFQTTTAILDLPAAPVLTMHRLGPSG